MVMLAEQYDYVMGGDPDRDTIDLAVLDTATGGARAHLSESTDAADYSRMLAWAEQHAPAQRVWALEGTGSFAAGLATFLAEAGEQVVGEAYRKLSLKKCSERIALKAVR
jgi:transposase